MTQVEKKYGKSTFVVVRAVSAFHSFLTLHSFSRLYFRVFAFLQLTRVDVAASILSPFTRLDDRKGDGPGERTSARKKETDEAQRWEGGRYPVSGGRGDITRVTRRESRSTRRYAARG